MSERRRYPTFGSLEPLKSNFYGCHSSLWVWLPVCENPIGNEHFTRLSLSRSSISALRHWSSVAEYGYGNSRPLSSIVVAKFVHSLRLFTTSPLCIVLGNGGCLPTAPGQNRYFVFPVPIPPAGCRVMLARSTAAVLWPSLTKGEAWLHMPAPWPFSQRDSRRGMAFRLAIKLPFYCRIFRCWGELSPTSLVWVAFASHGILFS